MYYLLVHHLSNCVLPFLVSLFRKYFIFTQFLAIFLNRFQRNSCVSCIDYFTCYPHDFPCDVFSVIHEVNNTRQYHLHNRKFKFSPSNVLSYCAPQLQMSLLSTKLYIYILHFVFDIELLLEKLVSFVILYYSLIK